jgi:hypothetical protein
MEEAAAVNPKTLMHGAIQGMLKVVASQAAPIEGTPACRAALQSHACAGSHPSLAAIAL